MGIIFGDVGHEKYESTTIDESFIVKNRPRYINKGVILKCLNFNRHWKRYYNKPKDIPFDKKKNKVIWRGTTTSEFINPANRFILIKKYYYRFPNIDIGFSSICQGKEQFKRYVKGKMTPSQMLKYKYILSVEGNDKDSGLNWKLNSNSIVLMPRPRCCSWLMETRLIPNFHYVLLKDDFSDLKQKYEWCKKNQKGCKQIVNNANKFM